MQGFLTSSPHRRTIISIFVTYLHGVFPPVFWKKMQSILFDWWLVISGQWLMIDDLYIYLAYLAEGVSLSESPKSCQLLIQDLLRHAWSVSDDVQCFNWEEFFFSQGCLLTSREVTVTNSQQGHWSAFFIPVETVTSLRGQVGIENRGGVHLQLFFVSGILMIVGEFICKKKSSVCLCNNATSQPL